jgi:hypothetical protein
MLMQTFSHVFVCETCAQSLSAPFSYTLDSEIILETLMQVLNHSSEEAAASLQKPGH